jgi:hypothetical protein
MRLQTTYRLLAPLCVLGSFVCTQQRLTAAETKAPVKCEANVNGFKIHNVYIMGDQYNGVVWAYKHIGEATCLTPTTDLDKADAILEIHRFWIPGSRADTAPLTVSCSSNRNSTYCLDSSGNELSVYCSGGVCTSYYGPSLYSAISAVFDEWISTRWYEADARLYTLDHKLLWKSENQKGDWLGAGWPDKVRLGTNSPVCKVGAWNRSKYKNYRHWSSMQCGVEFDPLVNIDIKLQAAQKAKADMVQNAHEAAALKSSSASAVAAVPSDPAKDTTPVKTGKAPPAEPQATVTFWSSPAGAKIELDGNYVGNTPSTITVVQGTHAVAMSKDGFEPWRQTIQISSGSPRVAAYLNQAHIITLH